MSVKPRSQAPKKGVKESRARNVSFTGFLLAEAEQDYKDYDRFEEWKQAAKDLGCVIVPRRNEQRVIAMQQGTVCGEFEDDNETGWLMNYGPDVDTMSDDTEDQGEGDFDQPEENEENQRGGSQAVEMARNWIDEHPNEVASVNGAVEAGDERIAYQVLRKEIQDETMLWNVLGQLFDGSGEDEEQSREQTWDDELARSSRGHEEEEGVFSGQPDPEDDPVECPYCGKEAPAGLDHPSQFACCGEVGHGVPRSENGFFHDGEDEEQGRDATWADSLARSRMGHEEEEQVDRFQEIKDHKRQVVLPWIKSHPKQWQTICDLVNAGEFDKAWKYANRITWHGKLAADLHAIACHTADQANPSENEEQDRNATWRAALARSQHGHEEEEEGCSDCGCNPCLCINQDEHQGRPGMNMPQDTHGMMKFEGVNMSNYTSLKGSLLQHLLSEEDVNEAKWHNQDEPEKHFERTRDKVAGAVKKVVKKIVGKKQVKEDEEIGGGDGSHVVKTDYHSPVKVGDQKNLRQFGDKQNVGDATMKPAKSGKSSDFKSKGESGQGEGKEPAMSRSTTKAAVSRGGKSVDFHGEDEQKSKPSAGLSKGQRSSIEKKAHAGKNVAGGGFARVEKKIEGEGKSKEAATKIAAAAMWKNAKR